MKAIILAAGKGKRLEKFTKGVPKCLLRIGDETVLEREIRILVSCGIKREDIFVVTGYKHKTVKPSCPNEIYNEHFEDKDNSYSLGLALKNVDDDVMVLDADLCFENDLIEELLADNNENVLLSKSLNDLSESTGIVVDSNLRVKAIGKQYKNSGYVYISIFKMSKQTSEALKDKLMQDSNEKTWYTSAITEICKDVVFVNHVTNAKWHEIDFEEDYYETIELFGIKDNKKYRV